MMRDLFAHATAAACRCLHDPHDKGGKRSRRPSAPAEELAHASIVLLLDRVTALRECAEYAKAAELARQAVEQCATEASADGPLMLRAKHEQGAVYFHLGHFDLGKPLLQAAHRGRVQRLGANHQRTLESQLLLALLLAAEGNHIEGEVLCRDLLERCSERCSEDSSAGFDGAERSLFYADAAVDLASLLRRSMDYRLREAELTHGRVGVVVSSHDTNSHSVLGYEKISPGLASDRLSI